MRSEEQSKERSDKQYTVSYGILCSVTVVALILSSLALLSPFTRTSLQPPAIFKSHLLGVRLLVPLTPTPAAGGFLRPGREGEEGVPLNPPSPYVRCDKVPLGANVNLITGIIVIVGLQGCLACKHGVSGVCAALFHLAISGGSLNNLSVHLCSDRGPDAVRTHQKIGMGGLPLCELDLNPLPLPQAFVAHHCITVLDEVRLDLLTLVNKNLQQGGGGGERSERGKGC